MGLMQKNICPECGEEYSALRSSCPNCGARKHQNSRRTAASSDSVRKGSPASARNEENSRWQMIFGLCLVAAVIIAVIVLITTTLKGSAEAPKVSPTPSAQVEETPTPTPTQTPEPTPTVEDLKITSFGQPMDPPEFSCKVGDVIKLGVSIYPLEIEGPYEWSSEKPEICTVDESGNVTAVSSGWGSVTVSCYGKEVVCKVWVK